MDHVTTSETKRKSEKWSVPETSQLFKLIKEKKQEHGRKRLNMNHWAEIAEEFNRENRTNAPLRIGQLQVRVNDIRNEFNGYKKCVEKPGWRWDSTRNLPMAPTEKDWVEAIESDGNLAMYRTKPFPLYKQVAEFYGVDVPDGENGPSDSDSVEEDDLMPPESSHASSSSFLGKRTRDDIEADELEEEIQAIFKKEEEEAAELEEEIQAIFKKEEELQNNGVQTEPKLSMDHVTTSETNTRIENWSVRETRRLLKLVKKKRQKLGKKSIPIEEWDEVEEDFNRKSQRLPPVPLHVSQLQGRVNTIITDFNVYRKCVEKPGWSWDIIRKVPIAPTEKDWDQAIESDKNLAKCQTKPFPLYKQVAELCEADVPDGENGPSDSDSVEEDDPMPPESSLGAGNYFPSFLSLLLGKRTRDDLMLPEGSLGAGNFPSSSSTGNRTRDDMEADELEEELQSNVTDAEKESDAGGRNQTEYQIGNADWTDRQTCVLLDLLLEKYKLGIMEYTEDFWKELCKEFNNKTKLPRSSAELSSRYETLKFDFSDYRQCAQTSGWHWDNVKCLPVAPNEAEWDHMIEKNHRLERCRGKPFRWYEMFTAMQ